MNGLCSEAVALDSNVFVQLLNPAANSDSHIDKLLGALAHDQLFLLVDDLNYIASEYANVVTPIVRTASDTGIQTQLLKYWMLSAPRRTVAVDKVGSLWTGVLGVIHEKHETCDRCFVCVAFAAGKPLITNDLLHIVNGPTAETGGRKGSTRRSRLHRVAKSHNSNGKIHLTREAAHLIPIT